MRNDEKKACVIVYQQEKESRSTSDMTGQRQPASVDSARMTRPAINYTQKTSKYTTSATSVVEVDRCRKQHYKVNVWVDGKEVKAVVDTAAEDHHI